MRYQMVMFDFDGTLADSFPWFVSNFDMLAERYHLPHLQPSELEELRELEFDHVLDRYKIPLWKMILAGRHIKKLMAAQVDRIPLVSGMQAVIDELVNEGVTLAVVSSNAKKNILRVLGEQNAARFAYFECGVAMTGKKSKFLKIIRQAGLQVHQALAIGDEPRDLRSARQANIPCAGVSWGYTSTARLQRLTPDWLFTHPLEILQALRGSAA